MDFDLENPLTSFKEHHCATVTNLFATESDYMPSRNFLHCLNSSDFYASFRQEAISLILQAQYYCNHDPFIPYLAVNYMDQFMSTQATPQGRPWILSLTVTSCLSLAAKMKNTHFSITDFQKEVGLMFAADSIHRMELLILNALNWRMRSVTPFSFVYFFISLVEFKGPSLTKSLKRRAMDIIFKALYEIKLLEFKPSIIAASSLLLASYELFPLQFPSFRSSISSSEYVNKDKLQKCFNLILEMEEMRWDDSISSTRTPLSVLDQRRTRSESTETLGLTTTAGTDLTEKREVKRRRLNGCSD